MNDRLIDMLTEIASKNPGRNHVTLANGSWNIMGFPPNQTGMLTELIDATDIRGSIAKFVNLHAPKVTCDD